MSNSTESPKATQQAGKDALELAGFFKDSITSFGVFYPKHYVMITMPSYAAAGAAAAALLAAGFSNDDVRAVTGNNALKFFKDLHDQAGVWADLMSHVSRFFNTEEAFLDEDIDGAVQGAGFLAVYCPDEQTAPRVQSAVTPLEPIAMHWYRTGTVQNLI